MSYSITLIFPFEYAFQPLYGTQDDNPFWDDIVLLNVHGWPVETNGMAYIKVDTWKHIETLPIAKCNAILAVGGEVEGYPCFIELSTDPATTDHPSAVDENGDPITWSTWLGPNQPPDLIDGKWYFEPQPNSIRPDWSQIKTLIDAGITVIEVAAYIAKQPSGS